MNVVITTGGRVDERYAALAGTDIKALAPVRGRTLLDRALDALRACGVDRIAVVGGEAVRASCADRVERFIDEGLTGAENVVRALRAWDNDAPLLYVTSDLPYVTADALRAFVMRVPRNAIAMPICAHAAYVARFPAAPRCGIALGGRRIVNGGAFYLPSGSARRITAFATRFFDARKQPWRMATLVGPLFLLTFALRTLSIGALEREASRVLGFPCIALHDSAPELAFDADTLEDYRYARERD